MPFNLYVTRPGGPTFKATGSPYTTREATAATVRTILAMGCPPDEEMEQFTTDVIDTPPGLTLTHEPTGIAFRTEEF